MNHPGITIIESRLMIPGHVAASSNGRVVWLGRIAELPDDLTPNSFTVSPVDYDEFRNRTSQATPQETE